MQPLQWRVQPWATRSRTLPLSSSSILWYQLSWEVNRHTVQHNDPVFQLRRACVWLRVTASAISADLSQLAGGNDFTCYKLMNDRCPTWLGRLVAAREIAVVVVVASSAKREITVESIDARDVSSIDVVAQVVSLQTETVTIHARAHVALEHLPAEAISTSGVHRKQFKLEVAAGVFRSVGGGEFRRFVHVGRHIVGNRCLLVRGAAAAAAVQFTGSFRFLSRVGRLLDLPVFLRTSSTSSLRYWRLGLLRASLRSGCVGVRCRRRRFWACLRSPNYETSRRSDHVRRRCHRQNNHRGIWGTCLRVSRLRGPRARRVSVCALQCQWIYGITVMRKKHS